MNPTPDQQVTDAILFEGALPLPMLTMACGAIFIVLAILFWKERRRATRPALVPVLFVFRILAVAGVWIALANPTAVRKTRRTEPKRAAVFLDTSASMNLQDTANGRGNAARWARVAGDAERGSNSLDEAMALLSSAKANLSLTAGAVSADALGKLLANAESASRDAFKDVSDSRQLPGVNSRLDPVLAQLESEVLVPLKHARELAGPSAESREGVRTPLLALARKVGEIRGRIRSIADGLGAQDDAAAKPAATSRIEHARRWLEKSGQGWLGTLSESTVLDRNQFDEAIAPVEGSWNAVQAVDANEPKASTNLQAVLNELGRRASDGRLDFAVLATDGVHNSDGQPLVIPDSLAATPLLVVPFGDYDARRDIELRRADAPKTILAKDQLSVSAHVTASLCNGENTIIELLNGQQVLDSRELKFEESHANRFVELKWRPGSPQTRELTVRVRPVAREASLANNEQTLKVSVVEDHFEILLVDSVPRWETRYLFSLFRRETRAKTTTLLFNPVHAYPGLARPQQPALPFGIDAWQQFQVVILGDLNPSQLTPEHQALVKRYVENGGHLMIIAGAESMPHAFAGGPIADMLPVEKQTFTPPVNGFTVRLAPEGLVSDVLRISGTGVDNDGALWTAIYNTLPIHDLSAWSKPKASARVLIEAVSRDAVDKPGHVFLATHSYGRGSVSFLSSPSSYSLRWKEGDRYHYRFWGQLVRALVAHEFGSGTTLLRIATDQATYRLGTPVRVKLRAQAADGTPLKNLEGQIAAFQLDQLIARAGIQANPEVAGEYEASFEGLPRGTIRLTPQGESISKLLGSSGTEAPSARISMEAGAMNAEMSLQTGPPPFFAMIDNAPAGMVLAPSALPAALAHFDLAPTVTETTLRRPLWNEWWLLDAIVCCLALEWIGRKFAGLI
jgi:hypothetical protein